MIATRLDALNHRRLTAAVVDGIHRDGVLAALEYRLTLEWRRGTGAIGDIDEPSVGMHVNRAGRLASRGVSRLAQGVLHEQRCRAQALAIQAIDVELVFPLSRHVDPRLRRVKVQMPRSEAIAPAGGDRHQIRQHAVIEAKDLERPRILGLAARGIIAARGEDHRAVVRGGQDLVGVDPRVQRGGLLHQRTDRPVAVDAVDGDPARQVVRDQHKIAGAIQAHVDRTRRQRLRLAVRLQRTGRGIDAKCGQVVRFARRLPDPRLLEAT